MSSFKGPTIWSSPMSPVDETNESLDDFLDSEPLFMIPLQDPLVFMDESKQDHVTTNESIISLAPTSVGNLQLTPRSPTRSGGDHARISPKPRVYETSPKSKRTRNPIRAIVDPIVANVANVAQPTKLLERISLALGDPACYDNLEPCGVLMEAAVDCAANNRTCRGYAPACGSDDARSAIAHYYSMPNRKVDPEDVVVASGCSGALELILTALLRDNGSQESLVLVPQPGFPLYQVIAESHGASVVHYKLDSERDWSVDLSDLECLLDLHKDRVCGVVITNPSNPCGSVFSKSHLKEILRLGARYDVPIVSDEVYGDMVFASRGVKYHCMGHVAFEMLHDPNDSLPPPVIMASGLGKQFLVPGWRLGWIVFFDYSVEKQLQEINAGVKRLAQVILGASHLAQGVISAVLKPKSLEAEMEIKLWKTKLLKTLEEQSEYLNQHLAHTPGLRVIPSCGAMYTMVEIDLSKFHSIDSDVKFTTRLLEEQNVFVLPGSAFGAPGYFRVVYCAPIKVLENACRRIANFCARETSCRRFIGSINGAPGLAEMPTLVSKK